MEGTQRLIFWVWNLEVDATNWSNIWNAKCREVGMCMWQTNWLLEHWNKKKSTKQMPESVDHENEELNRRRCGLITFFFVMLLLPERCTATGFSNGRYNFLQDSQHSFDSISLGILLEIVSVVLRLSPSFLNFCAYFSSNFNKICSKISL